MTELRSKLALLGRAGRTGCALFVGLLAVWGVALGVACWLWPGGPPYGPPVPPLTRGSSRPIDAPAIHPVAASLAGLADEEPVIGVAAGGHCRAYLVRALASAPRAHVVNDVLGGEAVSVTYCNIYRCARAFSGGAGVEPLDLSQGGLAQGTLVLLARGYHYRQDSGEAMDPLAPPFPYPPYPAEETTWGEWRRAHPDSDVYLAPPPEGAG
jgi:hypothetical protein